MSASNWPQVDLSNIDRLKVLAAGLPGTVVLERHLDAPFERVWAWVSDLERSTPYFDRDVASVELRWRDRDRMQIVSRLPWWMGRARVAFDVDLRPGWCWMVARNGLYVVGMAAETSGDRTRFAHLEGLTLRGPAWLHRLARPAMVASRWRHRRHVRHDLDGIARGISEQT